MSQDQDLKPFTKRLGFVDKGRKLALGAVLATSAAGLNAQTIAPELDKILKSPRVSTDPITDCVDDNSPRTLNLIIAGYGDSTFGHSVMDYHANLTDRVKGIRRELPCD